MNADIRQLLSDGERALRSDQITAAREAFVEAGVVAAKFGLWRSALRCYKSALEIDLADREVVQRICAMPARVVAFGEWSEYLRAIDRRPWPKLSCRGAQLVAGNQGTIVDLVGSGPALDMIMTASDLVEVRPETRYTGMPLAMALIILRRALWPVARAIAAEPAAIRVVYDGRRTTKLDELGNWELLRVA